MLSLAGLAAGQEFTVLADKDGGTWLRDARERRVGANTKSGVKRVIVDIGDIAFPQLADGDGWKTSWMLTNLETTTQTFRFGLADDQGRDLSLPVTVGGRATTAAVISITLAPSATVLVETDGTSPTLRQGFALVLTDRKIAGIGVFRQRVAGRPDFEAVIPAVSILDDRVVLIFDNSNGYTTAAALMAPSTMSDIDVSVTIRDEAGTILEATTMHMARFSKRAFPLASQWRSTEGRRGTVEFHVPGAGFLSVLGLRFTPGGAFTSVHGLTSLDWI